MQQKKIVNQNEKLQALLDALPEEFMRITEKQQTVALSLYRLLAKGNAVSKCQLAEYAGVTISDVDELFEFSGGVYFNDEKNIIGFWGLTIEPMGHKFNVDGNELYAWCAWDALFLPSILGKTVEIYSNCPISKDDIYLKLSPAGTYEVKPESIVISFIEPDTDGIKEDVISNFCHSILFFKSSKESECWVTEHSGTFTMDLHTALTLANMKNQQKYPNLL